MKIALVIGSLTTQGGGQRQILELACQLSERGHDAVLFTSEFALQECYPQLCMEVEICTIKTYNNNLNKKLYFPLLNQIKDLINIVRVGQRIAGWKPDVINPHDWPGNWMGIVAKLLHRRKPHLVWMANDVWHIYNPLQKKVSLDIRLRRIIDVWLVKRWVDRTVVLDHRLQRLVNKFYQHRATVVRSGLDRVRFSSLSEKQKQTAKKRQLQRLGITADSLVLLSVAVFFRHRRLEDTILAIKQLVEQKNLQLPSFKYIIVGDKKGDLEYYKMIQSLIRANGLKNIVYVIGESVSEDELLKFYCSCDIFVFPNDKQTWGLAPLEAMALGKPCIVSQGAGVHEVLTDDKTALLVEPRRPEQLADKIYMLLRDKDLRQRLGENSRKFVISNFSWGNYASDMEKIFSL